MEDINNQNFKIYSDETKNDEINLKKNFLLIYS